MPFLRYLGNTSNPNTVWYAPLGLWREVSWYNSSGNSGEFVVHPLIKPTTSPSSIATKKFSLNAKNLFLISSSFADSDSGKHSSSIAIISFKS